MTQISAATSRHINIALLAEIERLEAIHGRCGDDWPEGFDANDIWMLQMIVRHFPQDAVGSIPLPDANSKPMQFTIALIPAYLAANRSSISPAEALALEDVYARFPRWW